MLATFWSCLCQAYWATLWSFISAKTLQINGNHQQGSIQLTSFCCTAQVRNHETRLILKLNLKNASASKDHTSLCNDLGDLLLFGHCSFECLLALLIFTPETVVATPGGGTTFSTAGASRLRSTNPRAKPVGFRWFSQLQSVRTFSLQV